MPNLNTTKPPSTLNSLLHSWWKNLVVLLVINIVCLIGIAVISNKNRQLALDLQKARENQLQSGFQSQNIVVQDSLEKYSEDARRIETLFPNDDGVFELINTMDELKAQNIITDFGIVSDAIVEDKLGFAGLPISIVLTGTKDQVNNSLAQIEELDILVNPIYLEITKADAGLYEYKLGGFLYVNEKFN